jgi:shikimate kinase
VREIFESDGEDAFRASETAALEGALSSRAAVIAAAGGVVVRDSNREMLNRERSAGRVIVVWLKGSPSTLARRAASGGHRPLLDDGAETVLTRLEAERSPLYAEVSDGSVETEGKSAAEVTEEVLALVSGLSR